MEYDQIASGGAGVPCWMNPYPTLMAAFLKSSYGDLPFLLLPNICIREKEERGDSLPKPALHALTPQLCLRRINKAALQPLSLSGVLVRDGNGIKYFLLNLLFPGIFIF